MTDIIFSSVTWDDFEDLLALRILVMQDHLERIGRFDPDSTRNQFKAGFEPQYMREICMGGNSAGVVSLKPFDDGSESKKLIEYNGIEYGQDILRGKIGDDARREILQFLSP